MRYFLFNIFTKEQLLKQKKEMEQRRLEEMYEEAKIHDQKRLLVY